MSNKYTNPPFLEAVFELHTISDNNDWDITYHGLFYEAVKELLPNKKTKKKSDLSIIINPQGINVASNKNELVFLTSSNDEANLMVQFSENHLVVNALQPYVHWVSYKSCINKCLAAYRKIVKPSKITNLSLRYINKLNTGEKHSYENIEQVFHIRPFIPNHISNKTKSFQMITEYLLENEESVLSIQQASLRSTDKMPAPVLFDLTYLHLKFENLNFIDIDNWLETAHNHIESAFEKGLSEFIKQKFN